MAENSEGTFTAKFPKGITVSLSLPWFEILGEIWKQGNKLFRGQANEGMYEVLEYESTLELLNSTGKKARFTKRKKVRYLQDNIIAYQDHAWGDGQILQNYQCSPGVVVDQYRLGYKTHVLLSLREVKSRGDIDEFNIKWDHLNGYLKPNGFWDTDITQRTQKIKVQVIFPADRHSKRVTMHEINCYRTHNLGKENRKKLSDGRLKVTWEKKKPRLFEHYLLKWVW